MAGNYSFQLCLAEVQLQTCRLNQTDYDAQKVELVPDVFSQPGERSGLEIAVQS